MVVISHKKAVLSIVISKNCHPFAYEGLIAWRPKAISSPRWNTNVQIVIKVQPVDGILSLGVLFIPSIIVQGSPAPALI